MMVLRGFRGLQGASKAPMRASGNLKEPKGASKEFREPQKAQVEAFRRPRRHGKAKEDLAGV